MAPYRQWVLSAPFQLRFLFASYPDLMGKALGIVTRCIATTPAKRGKGSKQKGDHESDDRTPMERHASMTWARRLKLD